MLEIGFTLLKQYGFAHMAVDKIASSVGIGKGTFYHFFKSKEDFVCQLIEYQREKYLTPNLEREAATLCMLFASIDNVKENLNYGVISNLLKIMTMAAGEKNIFTKANTMKHRKKY